MGFFIFQSEAGFERRYTLTVSVPYWGSLYFNVKTRTILRDFIMFPSPIGVLYISILYFGIEGFRRLLEVSVPYWGSLYFNGDYERIKSDRECFRPLLGFFIFQSMKKKVVIFMSIRFRPLLGFFIFQFEERISLDMDNNSFRPLLGFFIFQLLQTMLFHSFVPGFRPLLGFFIFQSCPPQPL